MARLLYFLLKTRPVLPTDRAGIDADHWPASLRHPHNRPEILFPLKTL
jgi:hypothetical protein